MLQRVGIEQNVKDILAFSKIFNKKNWPQCLLSFLVILRFSAIQNLLSDLSLSEFPLVRRVKAKYSILKSLLLEAKKDTKSTPAAPIPPQNHSTGLSAPFQLIFKSNSSPQRTL